ncbi:hypothetical protein FSP39_021180 [Pinctada imbricata]|uniref:Uncharacterized protein n=1 Tax=Pinctada imbricata TaxID=66713 RepID=A0AA88YMA9_PINIB|nr:hypothetical protein FSP39_021180 [Pinctada imbricata]
MSDYNHPILLDVSLYFLGINEIDELEEKLVTTGYLSIFWQDFRLSWDETLYNDIHIIYYPQDEVWKPDIVLYNGFQRFQQLGGSFYNVELWSDGQVQWMPFEVFESRCSLDTTYYPFDKQTCSIVFVIWSFTAGEVMISRSYEGLVYDEEFQENNVWEITNTSYSVFMSTRESRITFELQLRRKPLFYVISFITPVLILGLLNCLVFAIPSESGEKTGYSVTIFLSLAVFLSIITSVIPTNSETTSILGIFLLLQVIIGSLVLLITSLQLRLCQRGDRPSLWMLQNIC